MFPRRTAAHRTARNPRSGGRTRADAHAGIFWAQGPDWRHYVPGPSANGRGETYDAGHPAVIGWRIPATAA